MKKKKWMRYIRNGGMVLLIAAGIAGGFFFVGRVRGWFPTKEATNCLSLRAKELTGTVLVEREGLSYQIKEGESLQVGDQVTLKGHGTAVLQGKDSTIYCAETSAFLVGVSDTNTPQFTLTQGELFGRCGSTENLRLAVGDQSALLKQGTADLTVTETQLTLDVLSGRVSFVSGDRDSVIAASENCLVAEQKESKWQPPVVKKWSLKKLSDFALRCGVKYKDLCATEAEFQKEILRREAEAQAALEKALNQSESETTSEEEPQETAKAEESAEPKHAAEQEPMESKQSEEAKAAEKKKTTEAAEQKKQQEVNEKKKATEKQKAAEQKKKEEQEKPKQEQTTTKSSGTCTIAIECSAILDHLDDLKESKRSYVPSSGVILKKTTVSFDEGETVYDVLARTCKKAGIQLEVSYSGGYGSYYVEGIGNLYEFDCGRQSGWAYTVNGASPNYGCSSCVVKDGDHIAWSYTCKGLGSDIT